MNLKMKKITIYILFFTLLSSILNAQVPVDEKNLEYVNKLTEKVHVFTDRDLYLTGEEAWFSVCLDINNAFTEFDLSKIVYLELFDASKKKYYKGKFEVINGRAAGNFPIPDEMITGNYYIRAYTLYQRNFPPEYFTTKIITIINPESELPGAEQVADTKPMDHGEGDLFPLNSGHEFEIVVQADKPVYKRREPVEMKISLPGEFTEELVSMSVSVARKGTMHEPERFISSPSINSTGLKNGDTELFWVPETRGISISGIVSEKNTMKPLGGLKVYLSVLGDKPQMHVSQTKANGSFIFSLSYLSGSHELFIGVEPNNYEEIQLFVNNDFSNDLTILKNIPHSIDTSYKSLIEEMLVNQQSQKFYTSNQETINDSIQKVIEVFGKPDVSVVLANFIDLPNLETIFSELVSTVMVRGKEGEKKLSTLNPETYRVFTNQLLLLDHVPVFNVDAILSIPPSKIEKIEVINRTHYLGDNTLKSVVVMNTYAGDFAGYVFPEGSIFVEYTTITPASEFEAQIYNNQTVKNSRIPDFRTTLYWNPQISISKKDTTITFYTSDNTGYYDIVLRGVTKNGKACFGKGSLNIR